MNADQLRFDARGLIPAIVQDGRSGRVLMLGYMTRESLAITLAEKRCCFYSRSRRALWRKGETSGHWLHVEGVTADCDGDALLIAARPEGPACHTGAVSCFFDPLLPAEPPFSLEGLQALILDRRRERKEGSYTSYLFEKGLDKILKKVGEEAAEVIIAGKAGDRAETIYEIADLSYHLLVLMAQMGIGVDEVRDELARRHVVDRKVKQERMGGEGEGGAAQSPR